MDTTGLQALENQLSGPFKTVAHAYAQIREVLQQYANGKNLKGDEIVGWFGEAAVKVLFGGKLVDDDKEHDVETEDGKRISVKTRKGFNSGWNQTSAIPKIDGEDCPTHLAFVHLRDDFSIDQIWLYPWLRLREAKRFQEHIVRGSRRSFMFRVQAAKDGEFLIHQRFNQQVRPIARKPGSC